jgi:hypothetical protein
LRLVNNNIPNAFDYNINLDINENEFSWNPYEKLDHPLVEDGGYEYVENLLSDLNKHLNQTKSKYRFIFFKCRNQHENQSFGKQYKSIRNFRVSFLPTTLISKYTLKNELILPDSLKLYTDKSSIINSPNSLVWGHNLIRLSEMIQKEDIFNNDSLDYSIKSNVGRYMKALLNLSAFDNYNIKLYLDENKEIEYSNFDDLPEDIYNRTIEINLSVMNNEFLLKDQISNISKEGYQSFTDFLNQISVETNQEYIIEKVFNDSETYESSKCLLELHPFENVQTEYPHISLLSKTNYQSTYSPFIRIKKSETRIHQLGYVEMTNNKFYTKYFKRKTASNTR